MTHPIDLTERECPNCGGWMTFPKHDLPRPVGRGGYTDEEIAAGNGPKGGAARGKDRP